MSTSLACVLLLLGSATGAPFHPGLRTMEPSRLRPASHHVAPQKVEKPILRSSNTTQNTALSAHTSAGSEKKSGQPCACQAADQSWVKTTRTTPKCIFIDLGANNGNSFDAFLKNQYVPVAQCPSNQWEALLVEANPRFNNDLTHLEQVYPGSVHPMGATAAYMCEAQTSFYLDTVNSANNYWGSSMSTNHRDVQASGKTKITVPTVNINRILYEQTIPEDRVVLKVDIEGAEWDILPCLAQSPSSSLIDDLFMEVHPQRWETAGVTDAQFRAAKSTLLKKGIRIPAYNSPTYY